MIMKKLIGIILACVIAFSISACSAQNDKEPQSAASQAETESQSAKTDSFADSKSVSITAPVMQTSDWHEYEAAEYNGKSEMTVTLSLPSDFKAEDTIIYSADGKKYAEVVGIIAYKDGQSAFDNIELGKNYNEITYSEKSSGQVGEGDSARRYNSVMGSAPTETGSWYVYCYALDFGEYAVEITMYSEKEHNSLPAEYEAILSGITVN